MALLEDNTDPIAIGSTCTVSKARFQGKDVAVKTFLFDELTLDVKCCLAFFFFECFLYCLIIKAKKKTKQTN